MCGRNNEEESKKKIYPGVQTKRRNAGDRVRLLSNRNNLGFRDQCPYVGTVETSLGVIRSP